MMSKKRKPVLVKARTSVMNPFFSLKCEEKPHVNRWKTMLVKVFFSAFCSLQRMPLTFSHGHPLFLYI